MSRYIFDIETNGLLHQLTTIHSLVIKDPDTGEVWSCTDHVKPWSAVQKKLLQEAKHYRIITISEGVRILMDAEEIIGHNIIQFDIPAIGMLYPGFKKYAGKVFDTITAARLIWPIETLRELDFAIKQRKKDPINLPGQMIGRYGLEPWGYRLRLHKGDYSKEMKAKGLDPWLEWNPAMQDYCENDVDVTHKLWLLIKSKEYSEDALSLEMAVQQILFRQEQRGFLFDRTAAATLYAKLVERKTILEEGLYKAFPPWFRFDGELVPKRDNKTKGYIAGVPLTKVKLTEFNPGSRVEIADRLVKMRGWQPREFTPDGRAKVDEEILGKLPYPEAKLLSEYLMVGKRIGQIAEGKQAWLKVVADDGRIHGRVATNGAVTRRMTHMNPNLAQVPSSVAPYGPECRALFIVPKGYKLVGIDASALELCNLAGYMAKFDNGKYVDVVLKGDKSKGTDIHSVNAFALGLDPKKVYSIRGKEMTGRDVAKVWFYAFIYGAGNKKLGWILGKKTEKDQASAGKKSRNSFLRNLPALKKLSELVIARANSRGFLIGLDGCKLHVRSEHAALNTLLQSAGAIIMKKALVILDADLQALGLIPGDHYEFVVNVHDEWQLEVKEEYAEIVGQTAKTAIRKAGESFNFGCPIDGEYNIGNNWAETH